LDASYFFQREVSCSDILVFIEFCFDSPSYSRKSIAVTDSPGRNDLRKEAAIWTQLENVILEDHGKENNESFC
jgi:hypothetical protein